MIHAFSMIAVLADQAAQAQTVVRCTQAPIETDWKWWIGVLASWVGPILSTAGSIYVAWRVFRWQGKKDREQWLLDQKRDEWRTVLAKTAEIEHAIPTLVYINEGIVSVEQKLPTITRELLQCWAGCMFITEFWSTKGNQERFIEILKALGGGARTMRELGEARRHPDTISVDNAAILERQKALYDELRGKYLGLQKWLALSARRDLGVVNL